MIILSISTNRPTPEFRALHKMTIHTCRMKMSHDRDMFSILNIYQIHSQGLKKTPWVTLGKAHVHVACISKTLNGHSMAFGYDHAFQIVEL